MRADVCSIYIYDDAKGELVLRANTGFNPQVIGKIRLKCGEGIAGTVFEKNEPVCIADGFTHPNFRYFKGTGEERYKSFLSVPIVSGAVPVGVIMLQRQQNNRFENSDIKALQIVASQLATVLDNIKIIISLQGAAPRESIRGKKEPLDGMFLKGKAASRGYAYAKATLAVGAERFHDMAGQTFGEKYGLTDLQKALEKTEKELATLQKAVENKLSDAASMIFTSHLLILKDKSFITAMTVPVQKGKNLHKREGSRYRRSGNAADQESRRERGEVAAGAPQGCGSNRPVSVRPAETFFGRSEGHRADERRCYLTCFHPCPLPPDTHGYRQ
jgi:phosphotransferase system enzyme I (PtsP)